MATSSTNPAAVKAAFEEAMKKDSQCVVGRIITEHESGAVIDEKIKDELHYSANIISRVMKSLGFPPVTPESINKHRRGSCRCI